MSIESSYARLTELVTGAKRRIVQHPTLDIGGEITEIVSVMKGPSVLLDKGDVAILLVLFLEACVVNLNTLDEVITEATRLVKEANA